MMTLKMNMEMKGCPMKDGEDLIILIQIGEAALLTLTGELGFLILIIVGRRVPKS